MRDGSLAYIKLLMSDFPQLCSDCLPQNDRNIKMIRQPGGEECKTCTRPFTVYRWPNSSGQNRMKKTIICGTCLKVRNCCQSCMVDLYFRIPLEIRDAALKMAGIENPYIAKESQNREVKAIMADKREHQGFKDEDQREKAQEILSTLAERLGKQKPAQPVHMAEQESASAKDISKVVSQLPFGATLKAPEDKSVTSFFAFGFDPLMPQYTLKDYCEKLLGTSVTVRITHRARCGFITCASREEAEQLASKLASLRISRSDTTAALVVLEKKYPLRICWGASKPLLGSNSEHGKIGAVVMKVMKQLAEKDSNERPKRKRERVEKPNTEPKKQAKKVFNAERDVEL